MTPKTDPAAEPDTTAPDAPETPDTGTTPEPDPVPVAVPAERADPHDVGVPMLAGDASEPQGPEDALGEGSKRGDYTDRVAGTHTTVEAIPGGGAPIRDPETGAILDYEPHSRVVDQTANVADIGDEPGLKGGVDTAAA